MYDGLKLFFNAPNWNRLSPFSITKFQLYSGNDDTIWDEPIPEYFHCNKCLSILSQYRWKKSVDLSLCIVSSLKFTIYISPKRPFHFLYHSFTKILNYAACILKQIKFQKWHHFLFAELVLPFATTNEPFATSISHWNKLCNIYSPL